jgi:hypothetical protein
MISLISLMFLVSMAISLWRVFEKAGRPGWAALVPFYNLVILMEIVGRPVWFAFLFLVPLVNLAVAVLVGMDLSRSFGREPLFGVGLALLGFICLPMLAFGDATYRGPSAGPLPSLRPGGGS